MHGLRPGADQVLQRFLRRGLARRQPAVDAVGSERAVVGLALLFSQVAADGGGDRQGQGAVGIRMGLGEESKLEARLDTIFLGLLSGAESPEKTGVGRDLSEEVDMHVDPARV